MKIVSIALFIFISLASGFSVYLSVSNNAAKLSSNEISGDLQKLKERKYPNKGYDMLMKDVPRSENSESSNGLTDVTKIWIKLGFSIVFGFAALFVVLSQKYNEETQKWAFSTLSLLAGVWIGTIS